MNNKEIDMMKKRSFTSPIRFFGSDEIEGIKKAIILVLKVFVANANKQVWLNLFCGNSITVSNDGKAFYIDFDDSLEVWGYNRIFNHALNIEDTENFGLVGVEKLTLVQLVCAYMDAKIFDGEFEYWVRFENGIATEAEPKAYYREREKNGNQVHFGFDSSLFLASLSQLDTDFFKNIMKDFAKENSTEQSQTTRISCIPIKMKKSISYCSHGSGRIEMVANIVRTVRKIKILFSCGQLFCLASSARLVSN